MSEAPLAHYETEAFREAFVLHYLQDFPKHWSERLLAHPLLRERYPTRTVTRVSLGQDLHFDAEAFYPALMSMLEHGAGEADTSDGSVQARFTPAGSAEDEKCFNVQAGDQGFLVMEEALLLAHPDQVIRQSAIMRHPEWLDRSGAALQAAASAIAGGASVEERFRLLREMQAECLSWRLDALIRQIRDHEAADLALVIPPAPDIVRAYLRLPDFQTAQEDGLPAAIRQAVAVAAAELTETFGPLEAVKRLSGIPVTMPKVTTEAVAATINQHAGELSSLLRKAGRTPMTLTVLAHAERQHRVDPSKEASAILKAFAEVHAEIGEFFLAILRWVYRRAGRDRCWQEISEHEKSLLLWSYANALTAAFTEARTSPKPAVDYLSRLDHMSLIDLVIQQCEGRPAWLAAISPLGYPTHRALAAASLAHVLCAIDMDDARGYGISDDELWVVKPLVSFQSENQLRPQLELLIPRSMSFAAHSAGVAASGTWLRIDARAELSRSGVIQLPAELLGSHDEISSRLVDLIANRDDGPMDWRRAWLVLLLTDPLRFGRATRQRLLDFASRDEAVELLGAKEVERVRILTYRAHLLAADRDCAGFKAFLMAEVDGVVAEFGPTARVGYHLSWENSATRAFMAIADAILIFCARITDTRKHLMSELAKAVELMVDRWPGALHGSLALLDLAVRGVSIADGAPAWEVIYRLRQR